jgi:hypothetical protein
LPALPHSWISKEKRRSTKKMDRQETKATVSRRDVSRAGGKSKTEHQVCIYIAEHPQKYLVLYPRNHRTLHREFLRAKKLFEQERDPSLSPDEAVRFFVFQWSALAMARAWDPFRIADQPPRPAPQLRIN